MPSDLEEKQCPVFLQTVELVECIPHMTDEKRITVTPTKLATSVKDPGECNIRCIKADASLAFCGPPRTTFTFHFHALEKEIATHSSVLAWRIPGTGEPGGLPSMGVAQSRTRLT